MGQVVSIFLSGSFASLEERAAEEGAKRALLALEDETRILHHQAQDWSFWDDAYEFMQTSNPEFISANLGPTQLETLNVVDLIFFGKNGDLHFGVSREAGTITSNRHPRLASLKRAGVNLYSLSEKQRRGLLVVEGEVMMVASSPITNSTKSADPVGMLVFTRRLDTSSIKRIGDLTRLELQAASYERVLHLPYLAPPPGGLHKKEAIVDVVSDSEIRTGITVPSLLGHPLLKLTIISDRPIDELARKASRVVLLVFLLGGALLVAVTLFLLHRWVLSRIGRLSDEVSKIGLNSTSLGRVSSNGDDELGLLAENINFMLSFIESHHTALEQARDEAEWATVAKGQFVANISHELRTPLHTIIGLVRILLKEEGSVGRREYLGYIFDAGTSLLSLINDVLDFSKMEAHRVELEERLFPLRGVLQDALRVVSLRGYEAGLEFICTVDPSIPKEVRGDPTRLSQVLVNLLGNAVKFTRSGEIRLSVQLIDYREDSCQLSFAIEDTGIGIADDRLASIFSPFTQADNTISRRFHGTGLGLTIARELVRLMGGDISVKSRVGEGSLLSFTVTLGHENLSFIHRSSKPVDIALLTESSALSDGFAKVVSRSHGLLTINPHDGLSNYDLVIVDYCHRKEIPTEELVGVAKVVLLFSPLDFSSRQNWEGYPSIRTVVKPAILEDLLIDEFDEVDRKEECRAPRAMRSLRVLLADDTRTNRLILEEMLQEFGHEVTSVENGQELVEAFKRGSFDMILTDVQMPVMDGLTATRYIRAKEDAGCFSIPIIAVTAHAMNDERQEILAAGVSGIVTKPIDPERLKGLVADLLK